MADFSRSVLTANNMLKRRWHCDFWCPLCFCIHETTEHLLAFCNFTEAVWNLIAHRFNLPAYNMMAAEGGPTQWYSMQLRSGSRKEKQRRMGVLFTFWWWVWKERNYRTFEGRERSAMQLAQIIQDEVRLQLSIFQPAIS
jgi:hypothetical protein